VPSPPTIQAQNLTNGALSAADFGSWIAADNESWTLEEWAQQHGQGSFMRYLEGGRLDSQGSLVESGGKIVDSTTCEYLSRVDAIEATAEQMSSLTAGVIALGGAVYVGAAVGPCSSTWTTGAGATTQNGLSAHQEYQVLLVTSLQNSPAVGQFVTWMDNYGQGDNTTADAIFAEAAGI